MTSTRLLVLALVLWLVVASLGVLAIASSKDPPARTVTVTTP